jgi:hypothetical protein
MLMLREIPFYLVLFGPWIFFFLAVMGVLNFLDKLTAKPKPPAHVYTPEEIAALRAKSREELDYETGLSAHHH